MRAIHMLVSHLRVVSWTHNLFSFLLRFLSSKSMRIIPLMEPNRKRVRDEHDGATISDLTSASPVKKVKGVVINISPMKKSKFGSDYFDGRISDGNESMCFTGYGRKVRRRLIDCKGAMTMSNCEVKDGRREGNGLEVHIRNSTEIAKSQSVIDVTKEKAENAVVLIEDIVKLLQYQRVTVEGKVVVLDGAKEASGGLRKQDLVVADSSGSIRLTIWEQMIGQVEKDKSYQFKIMVQMFKGKKFLPTSKTESAIEQVDNVGEVELSHGLHLEEEVGWSGGSGRLVK